MGIKFFKGIVSNCKKDILSTTTGTYEEFYSKKNVAGKKVSGEIKTKHTHYLNFNIGREAFRLEGDYVFVNGDLVALLAKNSGKGYHDVVFFKNFSKGFGRLPEKESLFVKKMGAVFSGIIWLVISFIVCLVFFAIFFEPSKWNATLTLIIPLVICIVRIAIGVKNAEEDVEAINLLLNTIEDAFSPEELQELYKQE